MNRKLLGFIGGAIFLAIAAAIYMWWYYLTPADFLKTPAGVLDDTIYAAQTGDLTAFKRGFNRDTRDHMDLMNDSNINRDSRIGEGEDVFLFWTWQSLMEKMAKEGGFEVKPSSTPWYDYLSEGEAKLEIVYYDKERGEDRQRNYLLRRKRGIWRIDLMRDSDFARAYSQSVKELRKNGDKNTPNTPKKRSFFDRTF